MATHTKENIQTIYEIEKSIPTSPTTVSSGLLQPKLAGDGHSTRLLVGELQGDFGGILFGVVDVLTIIPVSSGIILALNGDGARPSGTTSSSIGDNVENWVWQLVTSAMLCKLVLPTEPACGSTPLRAIGQ